jgi:pilus assembly protein TadC
VAVGAAVSGPCGDRLLAVGAALAVGSSPPEAWAELAAGSEEDPLAPAARMLARAAEGGAPVAETVARLAADARAGARSRDEQAARRVGVLVVAPLGLCFLPAFVLLGVVPVVLGLAGPLLAGH